MPDLADQSEGSAQSTEPIIIVSSKEESMQVLVIKWDHNNDPLIVCKGTQNHSHKKFYAALRSKSWSII